MSLRKARNTGTEKGANFLVLSFKKFKSLFAVLKNMLKVPYFVIVSLKNKNYK